jgi:hypothetical protein
VDIGAGKHTVIYKGIKLTIIFLSIVAAIIMATMI